MPLKELFLSYVELQKNAEHHKEIYGIENEKTLEAYARANDQKRKFLIKLEELETNPSDD